MDRRRREHHRHVEEKNPIQVGVGVGVALLAAIPIAAIAAEAFVSRTPLGRAAKVIKPIVMWPKKKLPR